MQLTLLISSLNKDVDELIEKMNISSSAVIVNQCEKDFEEIKEMDFGKVVVVSSSDRGVGNSRNLCIDKSFGDIVLFADDDIVYDAGYSEVLIKEFEEHPEAEMIMVNVRVCEERRTYTNEERFKKLSRFNIGRYPAYSIAVRRNVLMDKNLKFSPLFGGGAKYSNGEDSLFLREAYKKGIKMYASNVCIGEEIPRESTWFKGYTEKFFFDRGVLFAYLYGKMAWLWRIRFVLTKKEMFTGEIGKKEANRLIKAGIKEGFKEKQKEK